MTVRSANTPYLWLYLTTIVGGTPVKINPPILATGGNVENFQFSPNSQVLVYQADQELDNKFELYSVFNGWEVFLPTVKK